MPVFPAATEIEWPQFIHQVRVWPSASKHELVDIDQMHPSHAISAYRMLVGISTHYEDTSLAYALLEQAVGQRVLYADDVPESVDVVPLFKVPTLAECFDIMAKIDGVGDSFSHPVTRAQYLCDLLTVVAQGGDL